MVGALAAMRGESAAEGDWRNALVGPVLGVRLGGPPGSRAIIGIEGGFGVGPERVNLGVSRRLGHQLYYLEFDPWLVIGASFGFGIDSHGGEHLLLGVWEGIPLNNPCHGNTDAYEPLSTLSVGYRWTGVHELYVSIKAGVGQSMACSD